MTAIWHDNDPLTETLDELRRDEARVETPRHVEDALLAAWDLAHAKSAGPRRVGRDLAAVAAVVTIAVGLAQLGRQLERLTRPAVQQSATSRTLLLVGEPILQGEPVRMVRMRVPASTLTGLGVRPTTGMAGEHVDVDVIIGEDGVARAIRVGR